MLEALREAIRAGDESGIAEGDVIGDEIGPSEVADLAKVTATVRVNGASGLSSGDPGRGSGTVL